MVQLDLFRKEEVVSYRRCSGRLGLEFYPGLFRSFAFDPPLVVGYIDPWRCYFPLVEVSYASCQS